MPAPLLAKSNPSRSPAAAAANVRAIAADVFYPSSDGRPMAENMWQSRAILHTASDLEAAHPGALVAADILVYPEEGNRDNKIAPDVLVAFGLPTHSRSTYRVWEEGKPPDWVLEVASPSTGKKDWEFKRDYYAAMGVSEYWLFDPTGKVHRGMPRLQGFELQDGEYRPLKSRLADGKRMIRSRTLGLAVYPDGELLRFRDPTTGRDIRHRGETEAAVVRAEAEAAREAARARQEAAQREAAEAQAEQEATRREAAEAQAEQEAAQREAAEAQAEQEATRREAAEAQAEQEATRASREAARRSAAEARVAELEAALRSRAGPP